MEEKRRAFLKPTDSKKHKMIVRWIAKFNNCFSRNKYWPYFEPNNVPLLDNDNKKTDIWDDNAGR